MICIYLYRKYLMEMPMDWKSSMKQKLAIVMCDKPDWNRRIMHWNKCFREAEKTLNRGKKKKKGE